MLFGERENKQKRCQVWPIKKALIILSENLPKLVRNFYRRSIRPYEKFYTFSMSIFAIIFLKKWLQTSFEQFRHFRTNFRTHFWLQGDDRNRWKEGMWRILRLWQLERLLLNELPNQCDPSWTFSALWATLSHKSKKVWDTFFNLGPLLSARDTICVGQNLSNNLNLYFNVILAFRGLIIFYFWLFIL